MLSLDPNALIETDTAYVFDTAAGTYRLLAGVQAGDIVTPLDIDQDGVVLGYSDRADGTGSDLALWNPDGSLQQVLPGGFLRSGYGGFPTAQRNNLGQIVAVSQAGGLLSFANGQWADLTPQVSGLNGSQFSTIQDLNDRGQFVGLVSLGNGAFYGYVASPTPLPPTVFALAAGAAGLGLARRRLRR